MYNHVDHSKYLVPVSYRTFLTPSIMIPKLFDCHVYPKEPGVSIFSSRIHPSHANHPHNHNAVPMQVCNSHNHRRSFLMAIGSPLVLACPLHLHLFMQVIRLFGQESVIVLFEITRLLPQFIHLGIIGLGNGPYALPFPLVTFTVLFDTLLDLTLVKAMVGASTARFGYGL